MRYLLVTLGLLLVGTVAAAQQDYDYPFSDPLVATILGTPDPYRAQLNYDVPHSEESMVIFPKRDVRSFLPSHKFQYAISKQENAAPLIFIIAGTGGGYRAEKVRMLEAAFYGAGFHVVSLSSPTFANFITTASESYIPGRSTDDARDLHRAMALIWEEHKASLQVTSFHITGYSLGAANAAFVTAYDQQQPLFNFEKVMMINPPVSLYNSIKILDGYLDNNIPGPVAPHFDVYFDRLLQTFTELYARDQNLHFDSEFLYRVYLDELSSGVKIPSDELQVLIGSDFRLSLANLLTTADYAAQRGYIIPKGHHFSATESTTDYFKVATRTSFVDYFEQVFVPYFKEKSPQITREQLIRETGLSSIEDFLKTADNIAVVHNADDIILAEGEIDYLRRVFGSRAKIYPKGGHCGNMFYPENLAFVVNYFKQ